jgi:hypothetical protein
MVGSREHGNKSLVSIKSGKFLDQLGNYRFLKKDCAAVLVYPQ